MAKRMRRVKTLTVGASAVTGVRDFTYSPANPQYDRTRADNEAVGDEVAMGSDGWDIGFELLMPSASVVDGMVETLVATGQVVERTSTLTFETVTDVVLTFTQGHLEVGGDLNTDNPGRIRVRGNFKTLAIT